MPRLRLDRLVQERGLAPTREKAQALILAGQILVNGQKVEKPGANVKPDAALALLVSVKVLRRRWPARALAMLIVLLATWMILIFGLILISDRAMT